MPNHLGDFVMATPILHDVKRAYPEARLTAMCMAPLASLVEDDPNVDEVFAFNKPTPFIETNIRRVFIHFFFSRQKSIRDKDIMALVEKTLDRKNPREWYYALMDYGAMLGRETTQNPNRRSRHYHHQSRFAGSDRQLRGKILQLLLADSSISAREIAKKTGEEQVRVLRIFAKLKQEGFV